MGETTEILTIEELYKCVYIIRGQQVMFDQDLAAIYGYEVKRLNEQVKRNIRRFPEDFMFQIEPEEVPDRLKSQIAILNGSNNKRGMHIKKMTYAFTEQQTGFRGSTLYISQVKRKCGLEVGESYNKCKSNDARQPQCTPEKEEAIMQALGHLGMI